jgi:hypothetical protein
MREIKADVARMQAAGNSGDGASPLGKLPGVSLISEGFWSDGKRLKDSVKMGAEGLSEYRIYPWG